MQFAGRVMLFDGGNGRIVRKQKKRACRMKKMYSVLSVGLQVLLGRLEASTVKESRFGAAQGLANLASRMIHR